MMDMRAFSKGFDAYFQRARDRYGIRYVRCRVPRLRKIPSTRNLRLIHETEDGRFCRDEFDLVVLSVGMEPPVGAAELASAAGVELNEFGFCQTQPFPPRGDIAAWSLCLRGLCRAQGHPRQRHRGWGGGSGSPGARGPGTGHPDRAAEYPPERPLLPEDEPRIGVFICSCGSNIAGVVDVAAVTEYAAGLPQAWSTPRTPSTPAPPIR
jgi:heterodisulfide reductase subunit A2